jgi:hypothetical protein
LLTLGFGLSPWQTVDYVEYPSVGKFEGAIFDPNKWRPHTPTTAYMELRADDAFWAARKVAAFSDDMLRAIVHTGQFSDAQAEQHLANVLIQRRDKIKSSYLAQINPIINPRVDGTALRIENAAIAGGVARGEVLYRGSWLRFDNATGAVTPFAETATIPTATANAALARPALPSTGFVAVDISSHSEGSPAWSRPVRAYFRNDGERWTLVGLDRLPATSVAFTVEAMR